jgi:hypothetical protein
VDLLSVSAERKGEHLHARFKKLDLELAILDAP